MTETPSGQECVRCNKEREINEIYNTVKTIHHKLFEGNGDSLVTTVRLNTTAIRLLENKGETSRSRGWAIVQGIVLSAVGAALALLGRWLLMP